MSIIIENDKYLIGTYVHWHTLIATPEEIPIVYLMRSYRKSMRQDVMARAYLTKVFRTEIYELIDEEIFEVFAEAVRFFRYKW